MTLQQKKTVESLLEQIQKVYTENKICGATLLAFNDEEWGDFVEDNLWDIIWPFVDQLFPNLPAERVHPTKRSLVNILAKLKDSKTGIIWFESFAKVFKRVQKYDMDYPEGESWCQDRKGRPYFSPAGWRRYGFYPNLEYETEEEMGEILKNWHVAYHGTNKDVIDSIVAEGLVPPGAKLANGTEIEVLHGEAGTDSSNPVIYVSPSIEYSSHPLYTKADEQSFVDPSTNKRTYLHCVLQVRVRPGAFRVQGNTLWNWTDNPEEENNNSFFRENVLYDRNFSPREIEWLIPKTNAADIRVTGLMIRKTTIDPNEEAKSRFEKHRTLCEKSRGEGDGIWSWNCAESGGSVLSDEGPWKLYDGSSNKKIEQAFKFWQSKVYLGDVETETNGINKYYVDFEIMRQIRTDDNNLFRKVKRDPPPNIL